MTETDRSIRELEIAGLFDKDSDYEGMIGEAVKELLLVFQKQGHSGASAQMTAEIFRKLIKGDNLSPLSGKPDEWNDVARGVCQNNRNSAVFAKDNKGTGAYYLYGKIFVEPDGCTYTCNDSRVPVTFPWTPPKTEYVSVPEKERS
jgi:hypothetical protein